MAISKVVYKSSANATPVTWIDATPSTATADKVISGFSAMLADGVVTQGTGSAGAANVVTGTFTGTTAGSVVNINLSYSGTGYPVMGFIYPTAGAWKDNDSIRTLAQKYIIVWTSFIKDDFSSTPDYTNATENNSAEVAIQYKASDSDATSVSYNMKHQNKSYKNLDASQYTDTFFRLKSSTTLSVYIASTSYGLKQGIEYSYYIVYSS